MMPPLFYLFSIFFLLLFYLLSIPLMSVTFIMCSKTRKYGKAYTKNQSGFSDIGN